MFQSVFCVWVVLLNDDNVRKNVGFPPYFIMRYMRNLSHFVEIRASTKRINVSLNNGELYISKTPFWPTS